MPGIASVGFFYDKLELVAARASPEAAGAATIVLVLRNTPTTQIDATVKMEGTITRSHDSRAREGLKYIGPSINSHYGCSCHGNRNCRSPHSLKFARDLDCALFHTLILAATVVLLVGCASVGGWWGGGVPRRIGS